MNVTGIVVEYNPMHNGHLHHIDLCRRTTNPEAIIAVMSGSFVQRGAPAMMDKWTRTRLALENGVDLVIELPVIYSLSSAEFFAHGAVSILNSLGIVKNICFGSEYTDIDKINKVSKFLLEEPESYKENLKKYLAAGLDYPTARSNSLEDSLGELHSYLEVPNSILGVEYCKSIIRLNSSIKPYAVKREASLYSSSQIRKQIINGSPVESFEGHVPSNVLKLLKELKDTGYNFEHSRKMLNYIKYKYYTCKESIKNLPDVSEGIENRIYKAIETSGSFSQLMDMVKTKRYTYSRISRIITQYFIGFDLYDTAEMRKRDCEYARVLGFNKKGAELLKLAKYSSDVPLITKVREKEFKALDLELQATRAYSLINDKVRFNEDFFSGPVMDPRG
ncbi:MAG: nucleotidyltransferase [Clostridiaceae bacterium]